MVANFKWRNIIKYIIAFFLKEFTRTSTSSLEETAKLNKKENSDIMESSIIKAPTHDTCMRKRFRSKCYVKRK